MYYFDVLHLYIFSEVTQKIEAKILVSMLLSVQEKTWCYFTITVKCITLSPQFLRFYSACHIYWYFNWSRPNTVKMALIKKCIKWLVNSLTMHEKCPNTKFFLVQIQENTDQKKLCIWTLFTQCDVLDLLRLFVRFKLYIY